MQKEGETLYSGMKKVSMLIADSAGRNMQKEGETLYSGMKRESSQSQTSGTLHSSTHLTTQPRFSVAPTLLLLSEKVPRY